MNWLSESSIEALAWTILHSLWIGVVIGVLLYVMLRVFKEANAKLRYGLSVMAFFSFFLITVASFIYFSKSGEEIIIRHSLYNHTFSNGDLPPLSEAESIINEEDITQFNQTATFSWKSVLPYLSYFWLLGLILNIIWIGISIFQIQLVRRTATPLPTVIHEQLKSITTSFGESRKIIIKQSAEVASPLLTGWIKPMILLPLAIHTHLSPKELEAILAHEVAHIIRHDYLIKLFQNLVHSLLYYHPAMWWISNQIDIERENCCDDLAISYTKNPLDFAKAIVQVEEFQKVTANPLALGFANQNKQQSTLDRIQRLFGKPTKIYIHQNHKIMLVLFASLILGLSFSNQNDTLTFEQQKMFGIEECKIVKSVKTRDNSKVYGTYSEFTYDDNGREKKWNYYYDNGDLYYSNESVYDETGRRIKYMHYNSNNEYDGFYQFNYDDKGNEVSVQNFDLNNQLKETWEYTTNDQGQVVREDHLRADGSLRSYWIRSYDPQGNNIRKDIYLPSGKLYSYMESTYDDAGKELTFGEYYADGRERFLMRFEYQCE